MSAVIICINGRAVFSRATVGQAKESGFATQSCIANTDFHNYLFPLLGSVLSLYNSSSVFLQQGDVFLRVE